MTFFEKSYLKCGRTSPRPFSENSKFSISLDQQSKVLYSVLILWHAEYPVKLHPFYQVKVVLRFFECANTMLNRCPSFLYGWPLPRIWFFVVFLTICRMTECKYQWPYLFFRKLNLTKIICFDCIVVAAIRILKNSCIIIMFSYVKHCTKISELLFISSWSLTIIHHSQNKQVLILVVVLVFTYFI